MATQNELCVLDMGRPVNIPAPAEKLIRLSAAPCTMWCPPSTRRRSGTRSRGERSAAQRSKSLLRADLIPNAIGRDRS